jgi:NAD(P) transhydrogenase subunit alpha
MTDTQTTVGVVRASGADERQVALVPKAVAALVNSGLAVVVESGAGEAALLPDDLYAEAGATIGDAWAADVVVKVAPPSSEEVAKLKTGQSLIGFLAPRNADNQIAALTAEQKILASHGHWKMSLASREEVKIRRIAWKKSEQQKKGWPADKSPI